MRLWTRLLFILIQRNVHKCVCVYTNLYIHTPTQTYKHTHSETNTRVGVYSTSGVCLTTSLIKVATFFLTYSLGSLRDTTAAGKTSPSITISARLTECLLMWLRAESTCLWTENKSPLSLEHLEITAVSTESLQLTTEDYSN